MNIASSPTLLEGPKHKHARKDDDRDEVHSTIGSRRIEDDVRVQTGLVLLHVDAGECSMLTPLRCGLQRAFTTPLPTRPRRQCDLPYGTSTSLDKD